MYARIPIIGINEVIPQTFGLISTSKMNFLKNFPHFFLFLVPNFRIGQKLPLAALASFSMSVKVLTRAGICGQLFLANERVLLTGNIKIHMDDDQQKAIDEAARRISSRPRRKGLVFIISGPSGETSYSLE